jgi:hypothetical protein
MSAIFPMFMFSCIGNDLVIGLIIRLRNLSNYLNDNMPERLTRKRKENVLIKTP